MRRSLCRAGSKIGTIPGAARPSCILRERGDGLIRQPWQKARLDTEATSQENTSASARSRCGERRPGHRLRVGILAPGERLILPPRLYGPAESVLPSELWWGATDLEFGELEDDPLGDDVEG